MIFLWVILSALSIFGTVGYFVWDYYHQRALANQRISDQTVIEVARAHGGKVNVSLLCEHTGVSASIAKTKLEYLSENKLVVKDWKSMLLGGGRNYVLPNAQTDIFSNFGTFFSTKGTLMQKVQALLESTKSEDTSTNPKGLVANKDAQIISLAMENQGITTASAVCVKLNISIEEAQKRLEDLRQKQIFMTEVGQNGGILYRLLDS